MTRIHVNQHVIRDNLRYGRDNPPISVIEGRRTTHCRRVEIEGPSEIVYSPEAPLKCGARVWIETESPVMLHGESK